MTRATSQFHIVMDIDFPEAFQHILDYMQWLKGDIITYFNAKCWIPLDLYSEFVIAMSIIPAAVTIGIIGEAIHRLRARRQLSRAEDQKEEPPGPESGLSERLSGFAESESTPAKTKPARRGQNEWESLLNKMFILIFLVCELSQVTITV